MNRLAILLAAALVTGGAAQAGQLTVKDAWIRALPGKLPAGGYFTLQNGTGKPVTLTGVSSPACGETMLHESRDEGGRKTMAHVHALEVPARGSISFAPGGYHIMCMRPKGLTPGGKTEVTLIFAGGMTKTVSFAVRNARGQ